MSPETSGSTGTRSAVPHCRRPTCAAGGDPVRQCKAEYARVSGKDRRIIKGQKYTLLSRHDNLALEGRRSLALLLAANKRLNTAYLLKEEFGQLWDYRCDASSRGSGWSPTTLRRHDRAPLGRHRRLLQAREQGLARLRQGLSNKIRVFQRRAYGLRDEEYLRLKVVTRMLPRH
ncbi:transposase [Reyranella sp.]|uniref:transposase n=1 Tax=Reyranella sp. TaxID=1929291 RepID=UPI003D0F196A